MVNKAVSHLHHSVLKCTVVQCKKCPYYFFAVVATSVKIKSHYDDFSGSMGNVKKLRKLLTTQ